MMAHVMFTFGSGGHSTEMLSLMESIRIEKKLGTKAVNKVSCVISHDDGLIKDKLDKFSKRKSLGEKIQIIDLRRGRRVGQSYITSIWTSLVSLLHALSIVITHRPDLLITNGPALSFIIALALKITHITTLGFHRSCKILYVESFCRTKTLSLSGKLIYHLRFADQFLVQWPGLKVSYPRARFEGLLV